MVDEQSTNVFLPVNMFVLKCYLFPTCYYTLANTKQFNLHFLNFKVVFLINLSWKMDYFFN